MHCRLCLDEFDKESTKPLFGKKEEFNLNKLIDKYLYLKIKENDTFSTVICLKCSQHLEEFHLFCQYVEKRQLSLSEYMSKASLVDPDWSNPLLQSVKTEIIEDDCERTDFLNEILPDYPTTGENCSVLNEAAVDVSEENEISNNDLITKYIPLNCDICGIEQETFNDLKSHFRNEHNNQQVYVVCCKKRFFLFEKLLDHAKTHQNPDYFKCDICGKLISRENFKNHKDSHIFQLLGEEDRTCPMCYKVFTTLKIFKFHMYKYHPGIKPFHCTACSRQFTYRFIFQRHLSNECVGGKHFQLKPDEVKELENRKCIVCKKVFKNVEVLKWHMRTYHNGVKPFPCITCKRKFLLRRSLQVHLEQNSTCLKSLNSGEILHTYNEKVHKTQNVGSGICVDCNITFENINDLRAHMYINHRKSESTKPTKECDENLTCPICTSMFKNTESVEVHMYRYHRDIRPFKCSTCGRGFRMRRPYQRHVESVQNCAKKEQNKMKFVDPADCYCVLCKKRWSTVQSLKAHMYRTHRNVKPFSCPNCNEQFSLRWSLKRHIKKTHTKDELRDLSPIERGANFQISVINEAANQSDEIESYPDFVKEESISSEEHSSVMFRESNKQNEDLTVQKHSLLSKFFIEEITDDMTARNTTELAQNLEDSDQPIENRICVICNSIYKTADSLKSHMHRMHKNVKPFKCSICGEEFTLRRGFTRHMLKREKCFSIKHSSQVEKNSDQKLENISMIESTNTSQYDIPINMTNNSIDKNDVEYRICQVCNKTFKNIASLKAHMHIQHKGIRPFSCRNCGKRFILKTTFLRHFNAQKCFKTKITLNNCS